MCKDRITAARCGGAGFNPRTQKAEAGGYLIRRPAWFIYLVPDSETLSLFCFGFWLFV